MHFQGRDSPCIHRLLIDLNKIVVVGHALTESSDADSPRPWFTDRFFEVRTYSRLRDAALPALAISAAFVAVAAQKILVLRLHVAKSWNVNAIGLPAKTNVILIGRNKCLGTSTHEAIHHVVTQLAARVSQTTGKFGCRGVQHDSCSLQRRRTKKYDFRLKLDRCFRLPVDHPDSGGSARF